MKTMKCSELGGACDMEFHANSFEEIAGMSKKHGMEMIHAGDAGHIKAMSKMSELMKTPQLMKEWFEEKRKEFDSL
ncbi:MAG: DUF1059 domain-containing protein [Bacteroidales bacterium]|nr:DUF1059 domain-containing protein [Bacteroidales bacterium]MCB9013211.1 DUF1059 domain-containing protein [Bacteroidales bacterium]